MLLRCSGINFVFFFFSSRRRHTRSKRDWSSDVCSSDLILGAFVVVLVGQIMFTLPGVTFLNLIEMAGRHNDTPNVFLQSPFTILLTQGAGTFGGIAATFIAY